MQMRSLSAGVLILALILFVGICQAELSYETLAALAEPSLKDKLLSEADFNGVKAQLERTFGDFSKYLFNVNRQKAGRDAIFLWDSYDNPKAFDLYAVASLYEKISDRWGTEILHANYPEYLGESDRTYLAYLSQLQSPFGKLREHAEALASAYRNAVSRIEGTLLERQTTKDLTAYIEGGYLRDFTERARVLKERGEREILRKKLKDADPKVRYRMAWAIADLKAEEFEADIAPLLLDKDEDVRVEAVVFFTLLKKKGYEEQIGKLLSDSAPLVREWAADYVGQVKAVKYKAKLEQLLNDPSEGVRTYAKQSLEGMKQ